MNPSRLSLARRRRGWTKKRLAEAVGISPRMITAYEAGEHEPNDSTLVGICQALQFPREFFDLDDPPEVVEASASFRALSRMSARQRHSTEAAGVLGVELANWMDDRFNLPELDLPDHRLLDPETAAEGVRSAWGLGERPVRNVVHRLEAHGIRVFSLAEDCLEVDAFSFWESGRPFVFLNTRKSVERSRFDGAHELAHLVLHRHGQLRSKSVEHEANAFAAAFLMPESGVRAHAVKDATLRHIHQGKTRWGVSAMAYTRRLHDLGYLSAWHYRRRCQQLSADGYRSEERDSSLPRETSQVLKKAFDQLRERGLARADVAEELSIEVDDLNALIFGLVLTVHTGGSVGSSSRSAEHLHEVK